MNSTPDFRRIPSSVWIILVALAACVYFLMISVRLSGWGFPLDDAWIHQTYARNLIERGEWSFIPGEPSGGSTAPLWSALLGVLRIVSFGNAFVSGLLPGIASLIAAGILGQELARRWGVTQSIPWVGLFLVLEWHLVWAGLSGMETMLMGAWVLLVLVLLSADQPRWGWIGGLIGAAVWIRPDGLLLLGPAIFVLLLRPGDWRGKARQLLTLSAVFTLFFGVYLVFNRVLNGAFWPTTFYAKQAEYAVLLDLPLFQRLLDELGLSLVGAGLFLVPGFIYLLYRSVRERNWAPCAAAVWFLGMAVVYALRLPVVYQHGRYLMPAMPVYFIVGLVGSLIFMRRMPLTRFSSMLLRAGRTSAWAVLILFVISGGQAYARDVAIINTEMVATARWIAENTSESELIAVHDIGALGYFAPRPLIDLAGLVTPEVVPFIRDEARLKSYLDERQPAYLVVFPDWYETLPERKPVVFQTEGNLVRDLGGEPMTVYRWTER